MHELQVQLVMESHHGRMHAVYLNDVVRIGHTIGGGQLGSAMAHESEAPFPESLAEHFVRRAEKAGPSVPRLLALCEAAARDTTASASQRSLLGLPTSIRTDVRPTVRLKIA